MAKRLCFSFVIICEVAESDSCHNVVYKGLVILCTERFNTPRGNGGMTF